MTQEEQLIKLTEVEHQTVSNTRRVERLETQTEALTKLATSVELVASELKHQTETTTRIEASVTDLSEKVDALERKPAKRWDNIVDKSIWAITASVIAFILGRLGL